MTRPCAYSDSEKVDSLMESIREIGLQEPIGRQGRCIPYLATVYIFHILAYIKVALKHSFTIKPCIILELIRCPYL